MIEKYIYNISVGGINYRVFANDIAHCWSLIRRYHGERNDICILSCRRNI